MTASHLVLRGGLVVDAAEGLAQRADILVAGDRIAALGAPGMAVPEGTAERDAAGFIVITNPMPALEKSTCRKLLIVAGISRPSTFTTSSERLMIRITPGPTQPSAATKQDSKGNGRKLKKTSAS